MRSHDASAFPEDLLDFVGYRLAIHACGIEGYQVASIVFGASSHDEARSAHRENVARQDLWGVAYRNKLRCVYFAIHYRFDQPVDLFLERAECAGSVRERRIGGDASQRQDEAVSMVEADEGLL